MDKKRVYTCEVCSALYVCLKYFQEHRKKHASQDGTPFYPCNYCQVVHKSLNESKLHAATHRNEPPHSCSVCQETSVTISEEVVAGSKRSIGTVTDFYNLNLKVDQNNEDEEDIVAEDDDDDDEDDDDEDDDDDEEDDDDDDDDDEDEEEEVERQHKDIAICKPNVTNIIYVSNQTINHTTTSQQKNYIKPSRPSRSTGKGKGNRKARLTSDGDIRRKFSCCHCGKSFKTKSHLQRHILTHTGEKPYHCNRCDCRFNQSSSLRNHVIAIHTKEYPHTCNNCRKGFLMPAVLQKHLQTSECGKTNQIVEGV